MRILHFTYNTTGGAGKVARQLHLLFRKHGYASALLNVQAEEPEQGIFRIRTLDKPARKWRVRARYWLFRLYVRLRYPKKPNYSFHFNYNYRQLQAREIIETVPFKPDLIFLHWVADFILPEHIRALHETYKCPVIWRYNDLAPVTGGCHYNAGCQNYQHGCGYCPALDSKKANDWSRKQWLKKKKVLEQLPLTVINSTRETEIAFKASPLFKNKRQEFIRNSLDQSLFHPLPKEEARLRLGIPAGKKLIFWGATHIQEPRKGFHYLLEALHELSEESRRDIYLLIAGQKPGHYQPSIPVQHQFTGLLTMQQLAAHYQAASLVAVSSIEDGGPMMIVESLACGTPVVAFATGLGLELVITGETGYRAIKSDPKDLAKGLLYILNLPPAEYALMCTRCQAKANDLYGEETEIRAYQKLFAELL